MFKREGDLASGFEAVASASDVLEPSELAAIYLFFDRIDTTPTSILDRDALNEVNSFLGSSIIGLSGEHLQTFNETLEGFSSEQSFVNGGQKKDTPLPNLGPSLWSKLVVLYRQEFFDSSHEGKIDSVIFEAIYDILSSRKPEAMVEKGDHYLDWQMIDYLVQHPDYWQSLHEMRNTELGQEASINIASLQRPSGGEPIQDDCIELEAEEVAYRVDTLLRFLGYDDSYNPDKYTITNFVTNSGPAPTDSQPRIHVAIHHEPLCKFKSLGANLLDQAGQSLDSTGRLPYSTVVLRLEKPDGTALELSASGQLIPSAETGERLESKDCGWKLAFSAKSIMVE